MEFIFMLTRDDETLADAREVYASVAATGVRHVGCKDVGLPPEELRGLLADIQGQRPRDPSRGGVGDPRRPRWPPRARPSRLGRTT